jgi:mono/diheme cytochrome c family protein
VRSRILDAVRRGRGNGLMPAFTTAALGDANLDAVIGYLGGLCSGTPAARFASNCVTCHGPTGGGGQNADGVVGPNLRCQSTHDFVEKVTSGGEGMPSFPELTTTDVTAIASYVQTTFCPLGG